MIKFFDKTKLLTCLSFVCTFSDLYKMVCSENDTSLNISIPVLMIPKSRGDALNKSMADKQRGVVLDFFYNVKLWFQSFSNKSSVSFFRSCFHSFFKTIEEFCNIFLYVANIFVIKDEKMLSFEMFKGEDHVIENLGWSQTFTN